jgi:dihydroxy-acid dehydratase
MAENWRSHLITAGNARLPNRAMLRAVGFKDGDFDKPIVGVANGHSTMNPCNAGIQPLVDRAMAALETAGAKPQVFGCRNFRPLRLGENVRHQTSSLRRLAAGLQ